MPRATPGQKQAAAHAPCQPRTGCWARRISRQANEPAIVAKTEASTPPPEVAFIEELLSAPDESAMEKMLTENEESVNEDFISTLGGLMAQIEATSQNNPEAEAISEKLENIYKIALRMSMKKQMGG